MIEDLVYDLPNFVKRIPVEQQPKRLSPLRDYPYIVETDYSSFEAGFVPDYTAAVERVLFRYMLANNPDVLNIIEKSYEFPKNTPRVNKLVNKHFLAHVVGSRMSGEMWTSLGNGFSNLMNLKFLMAKHFPNVRYAAFVEGDDGLIGVQSQCLQAAHFRDLGFNIKIQYGQDLSHTSFCGNVFDPISLRVVVNPSNIVRFFYTCTAIYLNARPRTLKRLLRSKALSLYCTGRHTPIVAILAWKVSQLLGQGSVSEEPNRRFWSRHLLRSYSEFFSKPQQLPKPCIGMSERWIYMTKFGIAFDQQLRLEKLICSWTSLDQMHIPAFFSSWSDPTLLH